MSVTRCARCGQRPPWIEQFDCSALLAANPCLRESEATCCRCIGMSMANIIDEAWRLTDVPTDALMRALARRFL